jgi:hypothetical protein
VTFRSPIGKWTVIVGGGSAGTSTPLRSTRFPSLRPIDSKNVRRLPRLHLPLPRPSPAVASSSEVASGICLWSRPVRQLVGTASQPAEGKITTPASRARSSSANSAGGTGRSPDTST